MTFQKYMEFKFQHPQIKSYWDTATLVHLRVVYGCFCAAVAQLSNHDRIVRPKEPKIFII